jgi:hypothetical protein
MDLDVQYFMVSISNYMLFSLQKSYNVLYF